MKSPRCKQPSALFLSLVGLSLATMSSAVMASFHEKGDPRTVEQQGLGIGTTLVKFPTGSIFWAYNPAGAPTGYTDDAATVVLLEAAMAEWEGACGINFIRATASGVDAAIDVTNTGDGVVAYVWDATIAPAAGQGGPSFITSGAIRLAFGYDTATDGSFKLEPSVFDQTGADAAALKNSPLTFRAVALHELGHLLGLGHSDNPDSIMFANPYNSLRHLTDDDTNACQSMYNHASINTEPALYVPPGGAGGTLDFSYLAIGSDLATPITTIDAADEFLWLRFQETDAIGDITITAVTVDPMGRESLWTNRTVTPPTGGAFTIGNFSRYREIPGEWTIYVLVNDVFEATLPVTVTTGFPAFNTPPAATFTYTENPATRVVNLSVDVTAADAAATEVVVKWHIPSKGIITTAAIPVGNLPATEVQNVTYSGAGILADLFVEVTDDVARYDGTGGGNVGAAGDGFQFLDRYFSHGVNLGPDFGGDNTSDIMWRNGVSGKLSYWEMNGDLVKTNATIDIVSDANWQVAGHGDYNGDGRMDALWRHALSGQMTYWTMNGNTVESRNPLPPVSTANWKIVGSGDYNGDGLSDILWHHSATGQVYYWQNNGDGTFTSLSVTTVTDILWQIVGNGDYNGDGSDDILWRHTGTGQVNYWQMSGATIVTNSYVDTVRPGLLWRVVGDGDYNGDGMDDVLWHNTEPGGSGKVFYWQMIGPVIAIRKGVTWVADLNWQIVGNGDYNGDGRSDILWHYGPSGQLNFWLMTGEVINAISTIGIVGDTNWQVVNPD